MTAFVDGRPFPTGVSIQGIAVNYYLKGYNSANDKADWAEIYNQDDGVFLDLGDLNWSLYSEVDLEWYVEFTDGSYEDVMYTYH